MSSTTMNQLKQGYLCSYCGITHKTLGQILSHERIHKSDTKFTCDLCGKCDFKWKTSLITHMLVHTGEKKFSCSLCEVKFTTNGSLRRHELIQHLGYHPWKCVVCNTCFDSKYHLNRHYRSHTGEKAYECKHCCKGYGQKSDLLRHVHSCLQRK